MSNIFESRPLTQEDLEAAAQAALDNFGTPDPQFVYRMVEPWEETTTGRRVIDKFLASWMGAFAVESHSTSNENDRQVIYDAVKAFYAAKLVTD